VRAEGGAGSLGGGSTNGCVDGLPEGEGALKGASALASRTSVTPPSRGGGPHEASVSTSHPVGITNDEGPATQRAPPPAGASFTVATNAPVAAA
jgi:hypothetical protein